MTIGMSHEVGLDSESGFDHNGERQLLSVAIVDTKVLLYMPISRWVCHVRKLV